MPALNERRRYLLDAHRAVLATYAEVAAQDGALAEDLFWTGERLRQEYLDLLPVVALSRCPHTGSPLEVLIDTDGLDGLWWSYDTPLRVIGHRPPTLLALTGALRPGAPVPPGVCPGPAAPYVLPRMLADDSVVAVLSHVRVGPHDGFPIAYFTSAPEEATVRANEWGTGGFARLGADGAIEYGAWPEPDGDRDHDLRPWLDSGRLRWIAPGDASLELRTGSDACPYLGDAS